MSIWKLANICDKKSYLFNQKCSAKEVITILKYIKQKIFQNYVVWDVQIIYTIETKIDFCLRV